MNTFTLTDSELLQKTKAASKNEKQATLELLKYLLQVDERRAYATLACSSLFEYVHKILGYSEMQTSERVNSVRLMRTIPEVEAKIESGDLSMSTASQVHRFIRQEKKAGNPINETEALKIIEECEGHSKREVEKKLFAHSSEEAIASVESTKIISDTLTELKFLVSESTFKKLEEVKNLIGNESLKDIFDQALEALLIQTKKKKGLEPKCTFPGKPNATSASKSSETSTSDLNTKDQKGEASRRSRFIPIVIKRMVSERSGNQCEYVDPNFQKRCNSKHRLQFDHYPIPFAKGGKHQVRNLRHLCFQHNQKTAMANGNA
jgi:hypothetical protein